MGYEAYLSAALLGLLAGALALLLTLAVYGFEDAFQKLPIHWMWWPAIGGVVVGVGGYFQPRALGVGYELIEGLLRGDVHNMLGVDAGHAAIAVLGLILVKGVIWSASLGSGTSGGVLAPLLMMGGALGLIVGRFLPGGDPPLWALVGMAAILGGTMRSPLTGTIFALELTQDVTTLPVLLAASMAAHAFTVLMMKRSILTEKIARRGFHVSREYSVDPLERLDVAEVMTRDVITVPAALPVQDLLTKYFRGSSVLKHQGYPVVDASDRLIGVITRRNLLEEWIALPANQPGSNGELSAPIVTYDLLGHAPITVRSWESCRSAAELMAQEGVGRLVVVSDDSPPKIVGIITRSDLMKARARQVEEEMIRKRTIKLQPSDSDELEPEESPKMIRD